MPKQKTEVIVWICDGGCGRRIHGDGIVIRGGVWLAEGADDPKPRLGTGPDRQSTGVSGGHFETGWCRECFEWRVGWKPTTKTVEKTVEKIVYVDTTPSSGGPTGPLPPPELPRFVRFTRALARLPGR